MVTNCSELVGQNLCVNAGCQFYRPGGTCDSSDSSGCSYCRTTPEGQSPGIVDAEGVDVCGTETDKTQCLAGRCVWYDDACRAPTEMEKLLLTTPAGNSVIGNQKLLDIFLAPTTEDSVSQVKSLTDTDLRLLVKEAAKTIMDNEDMDQDTRDKAQAINVEANSIVLLPSGSPCTDKSECDKGLECVGEAPDAVCKKPINWVLYGGIMVIMFLCCISSIVFLLTS